ncbi:hypothetical protein CTAYLR_000130 [Chrysophaeum taylorii]|uniref:cellulase n=1 Tax=Chrysophaeum taylorii TaxID=2483200 RepID=A0AAD7UJ64_9STRA|nr:hypothetical protein CTAYLR_000130 [Chrysophaeum taylorii]
MIIIVVLLQLVTVAFGQVRDGEWVRGASTTASWDCCKPSCAWHKANNLENPVATCDAKTGARLADADRVSVCDGGTSATCTDHVPWAVNDGLAMGFAAASTRNGAFRETGLDGDKSCGQCFELVFKDTSHPWGGGAHPDLVGKSMVVQAINIGTFPSEQDAFNLLLPGAGAPDKNAAGCRAQFGKKYKKFDSETQRDCAKLPPQLADGCAFRFDWFREAWTNNPWVDFRRVRCPDDLVAKSGVRPSDDDAYPLIEPDDYACVRNWESCAPGQTCCDDHFSCYRKVPWQGRHFLRQAARADRHHLSFRSASPDSVTFWCAPGRHKGAGANPEERSTTTTTTTRTAA